MSHSVIADPYFIVDWRHDSNQAYRVGNPSGIRLTLIKPANAANLQSGVGMRRQGS